MGIDDRHYAQRKFNPKVSNKYRKYESNKMKYWTIGLILFMLSLIILSQL